MGQCKCLKVLSKEQSKSCLTLDCELKSEFTLFIFSPLAGTFTCVGSTQVYEDACRKDLFSTLLFRVSESSEDSFPPPFGI